MKIRYKLLVLVTVCGLALTGCGLGSSSSGTIVKIATVTPLSGSQSAIGEAIKNGAQMALEERKEEFKKLGVNLQITPQDDQADPKVGVAVAQKLIVDKLVLGVVGHFNSGVAIPSSEIYKKVNLTMVSPANTAMAVTDRGYENVNRICTRDDVQGPVGADFAYQELGAKSAFIIHDKTTYGQGVADEFKTQYEKDTGKVVGYEGITPGESDFSGVINKIVATKPDIVYFGGTYPEGSLIIKQMREKQVTAKFLGPDGMDSAEVVSIAGNAAVGVYYTSMAADITMTEKGKAWAEKFQTKFKKAPENWAVYGYDSMNVILEALKKELTANGNKIPTRDALTKAVRATSGYAGVGTNISFNSIGDNTEAMLFISEFKEAKYPPKVIKSLAAKGYLK